MNGRKPWSLERVLHLAARPEGYVTTPKWRHDSPNRIARKARDAGLLAQHEKIGFGMYRLRITDAGRAKLRELAQPKAPRRAPQWDFLS